MGELSTQLKATGIASFGSAIVKNIEDLGFGILSKADFEAFLYHQLVLNVDPRKVKNNYDWMRLLKVTPTKLRSLQMTRSAKFLDLDLSNSDNWKLIFNALEGKKIETEDKENGKVRIYIDDPHVHRLIEKFVVEGGSSVDYQLNRNQLVLKYSEFLLLLDNIILTAKGIPLLTAINQDKSDLEVENAFANLSTIFTDLKAKFMDKSYDKIAEFAITAIIKIV